jgi:transketolase
MDRWFSMGIAEQSGTGVAAGLAKEGKLPVFGTYGVFASGRNLDQLRTTVCYGNFNVMIAGAHGGVSVGPDGATHQALEELFQMCGLPNMHVEVPCDAVETKRATEYMLFKIQGPKYVRFAREATPVVTDEKTPYVWGKVNVIRFRGQKPKFKDAFDHYLASKYKPEGEDLSIIACGPSVPEAMRAAWILKKEYGLETRVLNVHTIKPLDAKPIIQAARDTGVVVTAEEHQVGGFGNQVAAVISGAKELFGSPAVVGMIGVLDRFGESGAPWELVKEFEVSAEHIAAKAKELHDLKLAKLGAKAARKVARPKAAKKVRRTKKAGAARKTGAAKKGRSATKGRAKKKAAPTRKPRAKKRVTTRKKTAAARKTKPAKRATKGTTRKAARKTVRKAGSARRAGSRKTTARRAAPRAKRRTSRKR